MADRLVLMDEQLKRIVVPYLREIGFKGRYPTLYRAGDKGTDLIDFQFHKNKELLAVNLARVRPGVTTPSDKMRFASTPGDGRKWLSSGWFSRDPWFDFSKGGCFETAEKVRRLLASRDHWAKLKPMDYLGTGP